jgi:HEAT repeats
MHRALPILLLFPLVAAAQDDPNVPAAVIAKKLSTTAKLSELSLKPLLTAPDDVRLRFLARPAEVKLTDENRAFLASTLVHKDPSDDVKVAAIGWLGKLTTNRTALKSVADLLADKNVAIRAAAIEAIGGFRDPTVGARLGKLLTDESPQIRTAAVIGLARVGDRKQVPSIVAAYKKYTTGDEADVKYGEALAMLGETDLSLKIAPLGIKSKDYATRLAAVHALECNPSMKVIPVFMDNLVLELRRTLSMDPKKPDWDQVYVTMCGELQRRTGKNFGLDTISWIDWWEGVRVQYGAPAPAFDRDRVDRWMADYQKMGPSKIRE